MSRPQATTRVRPFMHIIHCNRVFCRVIQG